MGNQAGIAGTQSWEDEDWLPSTTGLDWLDALRTKHVEALRLWLSDVANVVELQATLDEAARTCRKAVRDAVAVGDEPLPAIDPARRLRDDRRRARRREGTRGL